MLILKHVEYEITRRGQLDSLLSHVSETTSKIDGVIFNDIYFNKGKKEFILFLECENVEKYLKWREICPPPQGAKDWYEVFLTREEHLTAEKGETPA
jgi:hypothetical protein